jgi:hypothetical protein
LLTAARTCAPKRVASIPGDQHNRDADRNRDQKQAIGGEIQSGEHERAAQIGRQLQRLLIGAVDVGRRRDRHEHHADREQALFEIAGAIEAAEE